MAGGRYFFGEILPFIAMVTVQCILVGLNTIFKAATQRGLDYHVYMVYSFAISTLFAIPLAFFFHRNVEIPPIKLSILLQMFAIGSVGFTSQLIGYKGIELSSPTLSSVMSNLTPASTFLLAVLFKMEKLKIKTISSQVKIIGTILSISGAILVVFYKGPTIISNLTPSTSSNSLFDPSTSQQSHWINGGAFLAIEYILSSIWYILLAKVTCDYPSEIIVVFLYFLSRTIIGTVVCFILQPNLSAWKIKPDIVTLSAIIYAGIVGETLGVIVLTWALHVKGPVYVALFNPLSIVVATTIGVIFLGDGLYLGSIIGGIIISCGFYVVMWAKAREASQLFQEESDQISSSSTEHDPLLQLNDVFVREEI